MYLLSQRSAVCFNLQRRKNQALIPFIIKIRLTAENRN